MTAASHSAGAFRPIAQLGHALSELQERWRRARAFRAEFNRTLDELACFSDRELADIGVSRLSIREIAREHAAKKTGYAG